MVSNGQVFFRTPEWMAARRLTTRVSVASNGDQANGSQVATLTFRANALFAKGGPSLSADGLTIFWETVRGSPARDVYTATRASRTSPFAGFMPAAGINDPQKDDADPCISKDGRTIVFASKRAGVADLYISTRGCL